MKLKQATEKIWKFHSGTGEIIEAAVITPEQCRYGTIDKPKLKVINMSWQPLLQPGDIVAWVTNQTIHTAKIPEKLGINVVIARHLVALRPAQDYPPALLQAVFSYNGRHIYQQAYDDSRLFNPWNLTKLEQIEVPDPTELTDKQNKTIKLLADCQALIAKQNEAQAIMVNICKIITHKILCPSNTPTT